MSTRKVMRWLVPALLFTAGLPLASRDARAQAWVPAPGQGSVTFSYQYTEVRDHLFSQYENGTNRFDMGRIFGRSAQLSGTYSMLPGLAAYASVAYVSSMYSGPSPESAIDDGRYHGGLQDVAFGARYMFQWEGFALTPTAGFRLPSKNYQTIGHASVGRGLGEFSTGIAVGRSLDPLLPAAYATAYYERAFVENHHEHSLDQNRMGVGAGYFVTGSLSLGASLNYFETIDGIDWLAIGTEEEFHLHDVAAREKALRAGGSVSASLWRGAGLTVSYLHTLTGHNSHDSRAITISPTWSFSTPFQW